MGKQKDLGLKAMKGRIPAINSLEERISKIHDDIDLVKSLEYGTYIGTLKYKRWDGNVYADISSEIFCEIIGINKESVKVHILTMKHSGSLVAYELSNLSSKGNIPITFERFREFKRKDLELSEVPLYLNLDYVSKDLVKKYLM